MNIYEFTRIIRKREAINKYGKLGFSIHKEAVYINAKEVDVAVKAIEPFNYKKHIRFEFNRKLTSTEHPLYEIIDLGVIKK